MDNTKELIVFHCKWGNKKINCCFFTVNGERNRTNTQYGSNKWLPQLKDAFFN